MASMHTKNVVQELLHRKLVRNIVVALAILGCLYLLCKFSQWHNLCSILSVIDPTSTSSSASVEIMRGFRSTDPVGGVPLRILPLGDSITEGYGSVTFNGYRLDLMEALTIRGAQARYIGALNRGSMENNENDGFWGRTVIEVAAASKPTWSQMPNVVLLHVGTNDMNLDPPREPYDTAPERLGDLLDDLTGTIPNVTVLVAQIIQSQIVGTKDRIPTFNAAIPGLVAKRVAQGAKIWVVDMSPIGADPTTTDDGLHPNDGGYQLMSIVWLKGLQAVTKRHWLTAPVD